ncbi:tetratricopeptide repeat protein, partial [Polaromonas sp. YR568]|uniref:FimV/HubP-related protein n=1 Tax=Polaromonas sp. YR568 TaxID=1855301 RepID=UPI00398BF631
MITGNISSYSHGAAIELQYSAAMVAVLMLSRRRPARTEAGTRASFQSEVPGLTLLTHRSRQLIRMVLLALIGCTLPCGAVTLGDATLLSGPAQALRVEIELASELQPGLQVRLASEQAFRENGLAYPAWLGNARISLLQAQGSRRRAALLLQATQAPQAQLVELVLEFSWPTGSSQQPYVLLLDDSSLSRDPTPPIAVPAPVVVAELTESPVAAQTQAEAPEPIVESIKPPPAVKPKAIPGARPEAMRPPVKKRAHAGTISTRRSAAAAGPKQDRLRLAKAKSDQADRIAQERRDADQQARMQELEHNARQMRELADQVAAAAPQATASAAASAPAPAPLIPLAVAPAPKTASLPAKPITRTDQRPSVWPWVLAGLTVPLFIVWALRFWLARRRAEFTDSVGAAGSVFELSPAEAERAYTDYMQQRQAPVHAEASPLEDARALFVVGRFTDAQQLLDTVLRENPRNHEAWFLQARVLRAQGDSAGLARRMPLIKKLTGETGELWDRVLMLGQELD